LPISCPLRKEKALEYAEHFRNYEFQASSGWLDKFKKRHGNKGKVISRESVSEANCDDWKSNDMKKIQKDYQPDDILMLTIPDDFLK